MSSQSQHNSPAKGNATGHARSFSASMQQQQRQRQRQASSSSSEASSSSQVTAVSVARPGPYLAQDPRAAASTTSLSSSVRTASRTGSDLPLRQAMPPPAAQQASNNSRLRQHSQGFFEPSLPSHGNLTASAIAAQAAMHNQNPQHNRRKSQNIPEPLTLNRPAPRKSSLPPPLQTAPPLVSHSSSSSQSRNNSIVDTRGAAAFAANAAFPRSPSSPVIGHRTESPVSFFEKDSKPQKKESRMKLFSKPRHITKDKDVDRKATASPRSIYGASGGKLNQSTTSLAESTISSVSSFYASTNASTSTLIPTDRSTSNEKEKHRHHFLSRGKNKLRDNSDHHNLPLSSASSNSRPVDPNAPQPLYSFAPSSPGPGSKSISGFDLRHGGRAIREKRKEEKAAASNFVPPVPTNNPTYEAALRSRSDSHADNSDATGGASSIFGPSSTNTFTSQISAELGLPNPSLGAFGLQGMGADDAWPLLKARLLNIFEGEDLRTPIEDFNRLVSIHLRGCIQRRAPSIMVEDLRELLQTGFASLDHTLRAVPDERLVSHLVEMWSFVFGIVLPFIQAVFLPLDQEFKGKGPIMSPREAADFWAALPQASHRPSITTITPEMLAAQGRTLTLDVRTMVLQTYRDTIIVPRHDTLFATFSRLSLENIGHAAVHGELGLADRPGTASSGSGGFSSAMPGSLDPSSFNSQSSTLLDSSGAGSLGARSRATSNTSAGSFHSIGSARHGAAQRANRVGTAFTQPQPSPGLAMDSAKVTTTAAKMLQCLSVLAGLNPGQAKLAGSVDEVDTNNPELAARKKMERLAGELKLNWLGRGRTGRNRRGLVGTKPLRAADIGIAA